MVTYVLPNPGPPRYPCGVCNRSVRDNDKALLCDTCGKCFHIECTRVSSNDQYDHYCTLSEFDWSCLLCLFDVLPPDNVCDLSTGSELAIPHFDDKLLLPEDLFSGSFTASLHVVHHNVQGLLSKFTEITQWLHSCYDLNIIVNCSETWLWGGSIPAIPVFISYSVFSVVEADYRDKAITWILFLISKEYRNLLDDFYFTQHILEPSRVSRGSATLIDHISGSDQLPVICSYQAVGLSDHYKQGVDFGASTCPQEV